MLLGNLQRAIVCAWAGAAADGKNALQSGFAGAGQHFGAIRIEFVAFKMSVRIDVHQISEIPNSEFVASEGSLPSKMRHGASEACMVDLKVLQV